MTAFVAEANTGVDALVSSRSVTTPAGVAAGDVGVFWLVRWSDTASFPAVTPPAGAVLRGTIATGELQTLCYLHKVGAEASFAYSWTGTRWSALSVLFFSGADPGLDLAAAPFQSATGSGTSITTLTVDTVAAAALAWNVDTIESASGVTHTPPAGFTEAADVPPWSTAYAISPGDGAQSASGATLSGSRVWGAGLVALAPAATGTTGDAAVSAAAGLSAAGARGAAGAGSLTAAAALSTAGARGAAGSAVLPSTAGLAAAGVRGVSQTAGRMVQAALGAAGTAGRHLDTALTGTTVLEAAGAIGSASRAGVAAVAALHASGRIDGVVVRGIARPAAGAVPVARQGQPSGPQARQGQSSGPTARGGAQ